MVSAQLAAVGARRRGCARVDVRWPAKATSRRTYRDLLGYLPIRVRRMPWCPTRLRRSLEPISGTAFVESAVNAIVAKRMNKAQQMRWNRATVQPFLDVRTAVLNGTLEDAFRQRYPGFRPANDDHKATAAAA